MKQVVKQTTIDGGVIHMQDETVENWMDTKLGYLPYGSHTDTIFSNNLLQKFYRFAREFFPTKKKLFRQAFIKEKTQQWEILKKKEKLKKSFEFLTSDNPAAVGKQLKEGHVPKPNDATVIENIGKKFSALKTKEKKKRKTRAHHRLKLQRQRSSTRSDRKQLGHNKQGRGKLGYNTIYIKM